MNHQSMVASYFLIGCQTLQMKSFRCSRTILSSSVIKISSRVQWLKPVLLDTWEVEVRRVAIGGQPRQKVHETLSLPIKAGHDDTHLSS
jgi:hypothetical protein